MPNQIEDDIYSQQFGEEYSALREDELNKIRDKQATRYAFNTAVFQAYLKRFDVLESPEGVREMVMMDRDTNNFFRVDLTDVEESKFQVERKISKHEQTNQTLFDEVVISSGSSLNETISTESMRFAVKHVNDGGIYPKIYNLICPEFYKVPGVASPKGWRPDWINVVLVNEAQLESIKALL